MTATTSAVIEPSPADETWPPHDGKLCHWVCDKQDHLSFCGFNLAADTAMCPDQENCQNACVVCDDLNARYPPCPVCGTDCSVD